MEHGDGVAGSETITSTCLMGSGIILMDYMESS
jgi:hypothetical protein